MRLDPAMLLRAMAPALIAAALASCASDGEASRPALPPTRLAATGRDIAEYRCAACHPVRALDRGRMPGAPRLSDLVRRYPGATLEARLRDIASAGHGRMPGFVFAQEEVEALAAYVRGPN